MILVAIDHYSKWITAIPIRNKSAATVSNVSKNRIIPNLLRIPKNIITDNGLEFRAQETENVLAEYGIRHIYSSPYNPSSNGSVERANRTLINMMRALVTDISEWDKYLARAVILYNSTYHTQLGCSPSDCLIKRAHDAIDNIPVERQELDTWREGHPNFKSFKLN